MYVRNVSSVRLDAASGRRVGPTLDTLLATCERELAASYSTRVPRPRGSTAAAAPPKAQPGLKSRRSGPPLLVADRLSLPARARTFYPEQFLAEPVRTAFLDPGVLELADPPPPPRARVFASRDGTREVWRRLDGAGMLELERVAELPRGPRGECLSAGAFPEPKSSEVDRFVTSRTPHNSQEDRVGAVRELFPHCCVLGELHLRRGECARGSGDDLSDHYHTMRCSRARARTNQLGPAFALEELSDLPAADRLRAREPGIAPDAAVRAVQATMPMGDGNATDFAQLSHLGILRTAGAGLDAEMVSYHAPAPRGACWELIMIDDHGTVQVLPRGAADAPARDTEVHAQARAGYARAGCTPKASKCFRREARFEMLGGFVDGDRGWACSKPTFLVLLGLLLATIGAGPSCTGELSTVALGMLAQALLFERTAFAFMQHSYQWAMHQGPRATASAALSGAARDEFLTMGVLLPLLGSDLRAPFHDEILCTDARGGASPHAGVCVAPLRPALARELWRHRERRAGLVRMETTQEAILRGLVEAFGSDEDCELMRHALQLPCERRAARDGALPSQRSWVGGLLSALPWRAVASVPLPAEHVNLSELRALRIGVRGVLRRGVHRRRLLIATDSRVVLGACAKGRSSSHRVNHLLRQLAPELLFAGVRLGLLDVGTKENPADAPSRCVPLPRGPAADAPAWACAAVAGDVSALDAVLPEDRRGRWLLPAHAAPSPAAPDEWAPRAHEADLSSAASKQRRAASRRALAVLRAGGWVPDLTTHGDVHPHPGPRGVPAAASRDFSADVLAPTLTIATRTHRARLLDALAVFARGRGVDLAALLRGDDVRPVVELLRARGAWLYNHGHSQHDYRELLNAIGRGARADWRRLLTGAWDVARRWQILEPSQPSIPLPRAALRALVSVALLHGDFSFAAVVLVTFCGGLRAGEGRGLQRWALVLPADLCETSGPMFLVFARDSLKVRWAPNVGDQHATIDEPRVVRFVDWYIGHAPSSAAMWPRKASELDHAWRRYAGGILGLDTSSKSGYTFSSLRAGHATEEYRLTRDIGPLRMSLRHRGADTTLEHYVQQLPLALTRAAWSAYSRAQVAYFHEHAAYILDLAVQGSLGPRPQW